MVALSASSCSLMNMSLSMGTEESTICCSQPESSVSLFFSSHETSLGVGSGSGVGLGLGSLFFSSHETSLGLGLGVGVAGPNPVAG